MRALAPPAGFRSRSCTPNPLLTHGRLLYLFFFTKISEIYKGTAPIRAAHAPPKQGHEPVPIN